MCKPIDTFEYDLYTIPDILNRINTLQWYPYRTEPKIVFSTFYYCTPFENFLVCDTYTL